MAEAAQATEEKQDAQDAPQDDKQQAQSVELSDAPESADTGPGASIDVLLDMDVPVTAVIDTTEISVQRLLQLAPGSVLKLEKPVGAPVDLYLKDVKFATGTVVVIEDRFAVKIKEILSAAVPAAPAE